MGNRTQPKSLGGKMSAPPGKWGNEESRPAAEELGATSARLWQLSCSQRGVGGGGAGPRPAPPAPAPPPRWPPPRPAWARPSSIGCSP